MRISNRKCVDCFNAHVIGKHIRGTLVDPCEEPEFEECRYSDTDINYGDINPANNEHLAEICDYFDGEV